LANGEGGRRRLASAAEVSGLDAVNGRVALVIPPKIGVEDQRSRRMDLLDRLRALSLI
jgi:hypothetical protein